ncbi:MAG: S8 family serine peptidase [Fimbriimonadaceae bacterium]|nr:S8 family serine peptidase [Chitinophagales bacterium]
MANQKKKPVKSAGEKVNQGTEELKLPDEIKFYPDIIDFYKNGQTAFAPHPIPLEKDLEKIKEAIEKGEYIAPVSLLETKKMKWDGSGSVIAILDTGVFDMHDDLKGQVLSKINYMGHEIGDVDDMQGHGTHLAGIMVGKNKSGIRGLNGIAQGAKILSIKVTQKKYSNTAWYKIADGLERIIEYNLNVKTKQKITIVLIAFNAFDNVDTDMCTCHHRLSMLIEKLYEDKIPVIVSGGNSYLKFKKEGLAYPAHIDHVIAVGASDNTKTSTITSSNLTYFTQGITHNNSTFKNIFLCAPGAKTNSCSISGGYTELQGSSQAAAVMAGVVALMQQRFRIGAVLPTVQLIQDKLMQKADVKRNNLARHLTGKNFRHVNAKNVVR